MNLFKIYCEVVYGTIVIHELDKLNNGNGSEIQKTLQQMTGQHTVPSIWINGKFVGGNSELQASYQRGHLYFLLGIPCDEACVAVAAAAIAAADSSDDETSADTSDADAATNAAATAALQERFRAAKEKVAAAASASVAF